MGCFATCFGSSRRKKCRRRSIKRSPRLPQKVEILEAFQVTGHPKQLKIDKATDLLPNSKDKGSEKVNTGGRNTVTFDLNVKICEGISTEEVRDDLKECHEKREESSGEEVGGDLAKCCREMIGGELKEETNRDIHRQSDSHSSSLFTYPPNCRYQNCISGDDEYNDLLADDGDNDDDIEDGDECNSKQMLVHEESSGSLFSLSMDSRKQTFAIETGDNEEVSSAITAINSQETEIKKIRPKENEQDERIYADSVLNPVENFTQWKEVRARAEVAEESEEKENLNLVHDFNITISEEPNFKPSMHSQKLNTLQSKHLDHDIPVDTSLSSWLVGAGAAPNTITSPDSVGNSSTSERTRSFKDRPILGALTIEEIKQFSASSLPRWSLVQSPDNMPIIGTVGCYWNHTGQFTDSDCGSTSKRVKHQKQMQ